MRHLLVSLLLLGWIPSPGIAEATGVPGLNPAAPPETAGFAQLVGEWKITDHSRGQDGEWQAGPGADWNFYMILDGHAVQDDWITPPLDQPPGPNGRGYGTNIRIYNPAESRWEMAWASIGGKKIDTFTAVEDKGSIVMSGQFNGRNTRITFYDIEPESFEWKMEWQQPDESWLEVYRIHGERKKP